MRDDKAVPLPDLLGDDAKAGTLGRKPMHGEDGVLLLGDWLQARRAASTELAVPKGHGAADMAACGPLGAPTIRQPFPGALALELRDQGQHAEEHPRDA